MTCPVLAIGLDAAALELTQRWIAQGHLPVLARLFERGGRAPLTICDTYAAELPWTTFLTGRAPERTGYWSPIAFDPESYRVREVGLYDFREHPPFYAHGEGLRAAVFDVPQAPLVAGLPGVQVRAWGAHSPGAPGSSEPAGLFGELERRHGAHPMRDCEHAEPWDRRKLAWLREALLEGVRRRTAIACELLRRERFDLVVTVFSETHVAGHSFWHLSQPEHPLWQAGTDADPLREVYSAIDEAIGALCAAAPPAARVVVFSPNGMQANGHDLPSMVFLPELLYRMTGRCGLAQGSAGAPLPARAPAQTRSFIDEVWSRRHDWSPVRRRARQRGVRASRRVERLLGSGSGPAHPENFPALGFMPPTWYGNLWPAMPAFALPSYGNGHVRVNLRGRERDGNVEPADYDAVLERVGEQIASMRSARTGKLLARRIWRSRSSALDRDPKLPDADLVVVWEGEPAEAADCGAFGRIGPLPFHRSGGHRTEGFVVAAGPGIPPRIHREHGVIDLAPTLLELAGAPQQAALEGRPIPFAAQI